uniref:5-methylcytosine g t mismatch-specific dna n=1 Tax=Colletotrichum fructicola (strain Nara gc5) TaxID=1213859 RepID=L2GEG9_COLFN
MSSVNRDVDTVVDDVDKLPREKKSSRSKSERSLRSDKGDKEHRSSRVSSRSSKSKMVDGSGLGSDTHSRSHSHRRHRTREERDRDRDRRDRDRDRDRERGHDRSSSMTDLVPELARTSLTNSTDRVSVPYPTFSKAHSKEAVRSKDDVSAVAEKEKQRDPFTPEATDLGQSDVHRSKSANDASRKVSTKERPPSPPETDLSDKRRSETPESSRKERSSSRLTEKRDRDDRPISRLSGLSISRSGSRADERSRVSFKSKSSSQATYVKSPSFPPGVQESLNIKPNRSSSKRSSSSKKSRRSDIQDGDSSPESVMDSSPKTPTQCPNYPPPLPPDQKPHPGLAQVYAEEITPSGTPATDLPGPPPPPPPPPPLDVHEAPRVDYLLQNGGLLQPLPKTFLSVLPRQNGARPSNPPLVGAQTLFAPFFNLLDQYNSVLNRNGSVAVATGHRSVARRLLDRLENVFSRELPEYGCTCVLCERGPDIQHRGLGWGEVLEWVSGRIELPQWPPFDLATLGSAAADIAADLPPRPDSPIQIDPDIAEEFREHYLQRSKKVRGAVDKWLNKCGDSTAPTPQDVDDDTLTFAMLTNLDPEDQPYFNAILTGSSQEPLHPLTLTVPAPTSSSRLVFPSSVSSFVSGMSAAANRQAVSRDEEMEMAVLAEVEREIYQGMEVLEDAFEALHLRAEVVRTALRNRGAGLAHSLQSRRRIDVLPGSGNSQSSGYERPGWAQGDLDNSDDDWMGGDDFELAPDDSASNISSSRHRRPKRRTERRTPAPIEEDDEEN